MGEEDKQKAQDPQVRTGLPERAARVERRVLRVLLVAGAVLAVVLVLIGGVAVQRIRESARRATCKSTLRSLALACHMYADDSDEEFPPDLKALMPSYVGNPKVFSCPSNPSNWRDFKGGGPITEQSASFILEGGLGAYMPRELILIYDRKTHPSGKSGPGRNVAFVDAHVEWWPAEREAEFQERLGAQREAVKKWRAAGAKVEDMKKFFGKLGE